MGTTSIANKTTTLLEDLHQLLIKLYFVTVRTLVMDFIKLAVGKDLTLLDLGVLIASYGYDKNTIINKTFIMFSFECFTDPTLRTTDLTNISLLFSLLLAAIPVLIIVSCIFL